jgi:23S rRNA (uracil1939-C5)-methyltransferase
MPEESPSVRPRLRAGDELSVQIDRLVYGGQGVGRHERFVLFVDRTVPGETVRARVRRVRQRFGEADLLAVETPSPRRIDPRCPHFNQGCGGCRWQHLDLEAQLAAKEAIVRDSLERIGGLRDLPYAPILPSPEPWFFRNKMEFAFHPEGGLGLHLLGAWDRVFQLETCFLQSPLAVKIVKSARSFVRERGLPLYDPRTRQGLFRELVVRQSRGTGETMVGLLTQGPLEDQTAAAFAASMAAVDPAVASIVHGVRSRPFEGASIEQTRVLHGAPTITEIVQGLSFRIGLGTFFQTNTAQAERLAALVRELAGPVAGAPVIDLYCGVGLFALTLAKAGAEVAGIEVVVPAVESARENAARNGLSNAHFYSGDVRTALPEVLERHGPPQVLVLDPPRGGAGGKVMRRIGRAAPNRVIYVSCNPTTLARDLSELLPFGYRITRVQPVDLFPQTYHVETVVALERR